MGQIVNLRRIGNPPRPSYGVRSGSKCTGASVVLSGLPGSGKSTLARQLATALDLPLIDKDTILQGLFQSKGAGDVAWPGMPVDSGTPTGWLLEPQYQVVNVHCVCDPEIAAERFHQRKRHPGHLDSEATYPEILAGPRALERLGPLEIGQRVDVDTSGEPRLDAIVRDIHDAFNQSPK